MVVVFCTACASAGPKWLNFSCVGCNPLKILPCPPPPSPPSHTHITVCPALKPFYNFFPRSLPRLTWIDGAPQVAPLPQPIPCIFPVQDPASSTSISLECGSLDNSGNSIRLHSTMPHWKKVEQILCLLRYGVLFGMRQ